MSTRIEQLSSDNNNSYNIGSISLLKSTQKILQHRLLSMHTSLKIYVTLPNIEFSHSIPFQVTALSKTIVTQVNLVQKSQPMILTRNRYFNIHGDWFYMHVFLHACVCI